MLFFTFGRWMSVNFQFAHFQEQWRYWELRHQDQTQWDEQGQTQPWDTRGVAWGTPVPHRPVQGAGSLRGTGSVGQSCTAAQAGLHSAKGRVQGLGDTSAVIILQLSRGLSFHRHWLDGVHPWLHWLYFVKNKVEPKKQASGEGWEWYTLKRITLISFADITICAALSYLSLVVTFFFIWSPWQVNSF